ncbi:DUF4007 family protein [Crocosphaera sp. XPORK-15E]|nr:DUF4007 family protein [Crocosphaera sp. XPORK-15E]MEA5536669.1 DUF4007 family protein [Crocosphaera sp. XPORK-15E]
MTTTQLNLIETSLPNVNPVFARHETFHPRYGWLKKGFDLATQYPRNFYR